MTPTPEATPATPATATRGTPRQWQLDPNVRLVPVLDLDPDTRARIDCPDDHVAVSRIGGRSASTVVSPETAALVERFREPRTLVEALVLHARPRGLDPEELLEDAVALVERLARSRFLRPAKESDEETDGAAQVSDGGDGNGGRSWRVGDRVVLPATPATRAPGGRDGEPPAAEQELRVVRPVARLEDVEVYLVRPLDPPSPERAAHRAFKVARAGVAALTSLPREGELLAALDGAAGAPRLYHHGAVDGRDYLLMDWCPGVGVEVAARELRARDDRLGLARLLLSVAQVYATLHGRGVIHGDVHPNNLLVDGEGRIRPIDFGLARRLDSGAGRRHAAPPRGGVGFYYEPEWARALLDGRRPPAASPAGEQAAVGALLYLLATGHHRMDFSLGRDEMLAELARAVPMPFEERGVRAWPALEAVLARALAIEPADRFAGLDELAAALEGVIDEAEAEAEAGTDTGKGPRRTGVAGRHLASLEKGLLERLGEGGDWLEGGLPLAPTASVNYGAGGIALGLLRIAGRRGDARLLALAERWLDRARREAGLAGAGSFGDGRPDAIEPGRESAFYRDEIGIDRPTVGEGSPFHGPIGLHAVGALLARALDDPLGQALALERFLAAAEAPAVGIDLTLGLGGQVLVAAFLLDAFPPPAPDGPRSEGGLDPSPLLAFGRSRLAEIWRQLDGLPPLAETPAGSAVDTLGPAHGWAGLLHLTLQWCRASGDPLPERSVERLEQLAGLARPEARGSVWPWRHPDTDGLTMPGWCNGSAGMVALWTAAHRHLGDDRHLDRATAAAWHAWESSDQTGTLCCGLAGRAWGLLALHRANGEPLWLERARRLAERAAAQGTHQDEYPWSLYKGAFGLAVLAADLEHPDESAQPFYEPEGWPGRAPDVPIP